LDTRTYDIDFPDGRSDEYTVNVIAENMYVQCDTEGRHYNLMEGIVDHKTYGHVVERADMYIKHGSNKQGVKKPKVWHLCVEWIDGTTSWERLVDIKESNPVEVDEYAFVKNLLDAPDFVWWAPHVLKKRIMIIVDIKSFTTSALTSFDFFPRVGMTVWGLPKKMTTLFGSMR
jgi:hypothetical protein